MTVERHPDAENIAGLSVTLPRGTVLVSKRLKGKSVSVKAAGVSGARVRGSGKRKLTISKLSTKGSRKVTVTLRRGAVRLTGKVRRQARKGKRPKVRIKVRARDTKGTIHSARVTVKAKR